MLLLLGRGPPNGGRPKIQKTMSFLFYLLMVAVGLWLIRRQHVKELVGVEIQQKRIDALAGLVRMILAKYEEDKAKLNALMKGNRVTENAELDRLILNNALKREARAKEALLHVMRMDRCSEEDIERVMATIDKED
jgi:hypothetical protein